MATPEEERLASKLAAAHKFITHLEDRIQELEDALYGSFEKSFLRYTTTTSEYDAPVNCRTLTIRVQPFKVMAHSYSMSRPLKEREKDLRRCSYRLARHFEEALRSEIVGVGL